MNQPRLVGGRYQLLQPIGRGGMGIVWRAQDTVIGREVAIKQVLLPPNLSPADQAAVRERTLREARSAARIRHPAVVAVHDVIEDGGEPWIVMELVRGRSLGELVTTGGPVSPPWAASIGLFVLSALATAHAHGVLHRDVKPGNVLLADDGRILLSDFGVATQAGTQPGQGHSGGPAGTPGFTAPESLTDFRSAGPASDLWALGATIYTAVEGVPPYLRNTALAMHGAVMTEPPRPPQRAGSLGPVLMGLLAQDPARRPGISTLRNALQQITGQPAATVGTRPPSWVVPRVPAFAVVGAFAVAFAVALTLILTSSPPPAPAAATAAASSTAVPSAGRPPSAAPTDAAPTDAVPSRSPAAQETSATPQTPGKFTAIPRPCQLLTRQQATSVVGRYLTSSLDPAIRCTWGTANNLAPESRQLALYLDLFLYDPQGDGYESTLAHEHVQGAKAEAEKSAGRGGTGGEQGEVFEIEGAGDEAYAWELSKSRSAGRREFEVHVIFRTGNMVGRFRLNRGVEKDARLKEKAAQAAKWLVANLDARA